MLCVAKGRLPRWQRWVIFDVSSAVQDFRCSANFERIAASQRTVHVLLPPSEPGASLGRLVTKQQCRRLAGRVGMVEYHPRMVVLRYVSSLPPVKPLDSMG